MFRLFVTDTVQPERMYWREIIPESNAVLKDFRIVGEQIVAEYEQDAISQAKVFALDGKLLTKSSFPLSAKSPDCRVRPGQRCLHRVSVLHGPANHFSLRDRQ